MKERPRPASVRWIQLALRRFARWASPWGVARAIGVALLVCGTSLSNAGCKAETKTGGNDASQDKSSDSSVLGGARGLKLCNTTSSRVGVSIGYKTKKGWVSEGWWNVASNTCETVVTGKLINRYYYLHVLDYDQSGEWSGKLYMCTDDEPFTIVGVENCAERGYKRTGFFEVDTGEEPSWTVRLEDTKDAQAKDQ